MDLTPYLDALRADLTAPGGADTARAAELRGHSLDTSG
jgi:hypothetical protein